MIRATRSNNRVKASVRPVAPLARKAIGAPVRPAPYAERWTVWKYPMAKAAVLSICLGLAVLNGTSRANTVELWGPIDLSELVLKDPRLLEYFHLEQPGRQPIVISSVLQHPDLEHLVLGYAIKVVPGNSPEASRAFQFTKLKWSGDHATVEISYPPEGVRGRFKLFRRGDRWTVSARKLWEE
jgi:hypothetical protein